MKTHFSPLYAIAFALLLLCQAALADDNTSGAPAADAAGKLGIGFHSRFPLSGISLKYWTPTGIGLQGIVTRFGFSVPNDDVSGGLTLLGGRFLYTIQRESRVRFYVGAGASYTDAGIKEGASDETATGLGLEGVGGVEYSFSDLPNLGLAFEFGAGFLRLTPKDSDDQLNLHFTTSGTVGIHYYFNGL